MAAGDKQVTLSKGPACVLAFTKCSNALCPHDKIVSVQEDVCREAYLHTARHGASWSEPDSLPLRHQADAL